MDKTRNENEVFTANGQSLGFKVLDFWKYAYGDLNSDPRDVVAEFLVSKALGIGESINRQSWLPYDIKYREKRIEVKSTSYYQTWRDENDKTICRDKRFSIRQAEQNDIYVFCVLQGDTREEADPLVMEKWDFYIVPTSELKQNYPGRKTIPLEKFQGFGFSKVCYSEIKNEIDKICEKG